MVRGGFRHLVVMDGAEIAGILSMRDIVRCWTGVGATCEVPEGLAPLGHWPQATGHRFTGPSATRIPFSKSFCLCTEFSGSMPSLSQSAASDRAIVNDFRDPGTAPAIEGAPKLWPDGPG